MATTTMSPMQIECPVCATSLPVTGKGAEISAPGTCEIILDMSAVRAHLRTHE